MATKTRNRPSQPFDRQRAKADWQKRSAEKPVTRPVKQSDADERPREKTSWHPHREGKPQKTRLTKQSGTEIVFGLHAVGAALLNPRRRPLQLWCLAASRPALDKLMSEAAASRRTKAPPVTVVEREQLDHITSQGVHQGVVLEADPLPSPDLDELLDGAPLGDILVILDQVTDPHNIGAIVRSAAAFGARAIIQTDRHAPSATGTLAKAASGGLEQVALVRVVNLARAMRTLKETGYKIVGFDEHGGKTLAESNLEGPQGLVLALGAEGEGLRRLTREHCDEIVRLPTQGQVASLNVSNAAAIALYEAVRGRG